MKLQLIRNATLRMTYAQRQILIDPYLAPKHSLPSFTGKSPNPLVDLPCTPDEVIVDSELAIVSHLHADHFDSVAQTLLPKNIELFCQLGDETKIKGKGFERVTAVSEPITWQGIMITPTPCQHGSGDVLALMGNASGFIFAAEDEPTVFWVGDSILTDDILEIINRVQPDIIITHSCGAVWGDGVLIVMDAVQTTAVCQAAPKSTVIATHMESLDHATITRQTLRQQATIQGIGSEQLLIPADGETLAF
ncbi:MAG: MBL fold metallo-hydrolase [Chloroflexota bacterium]